MSAPTSASPSAEQSGNLDLLWGCAAIAEAIGLSPRATFHMLEKRQLPARKVGGKWLCSRRALVAWAEGGDA